MKKLIIFDMDGTLIDSSLTIVNAINSVRTNLGLNPMDEIDILDNINNPHITPARYFYEVDSFAPEHEEWFSDYYAKNHERELRLYHHIKELLVELKERGFKLAVATNAYRVSTTQSLGHLEVLEYFDAIACHDEVKEGKPHPEMLYKILDQLNISTKDTLFVGDGERDRLASESAQIDYLMVNWGFSDYTEDVFHTVEDLKKAILEA